MDTPTYMKIDNETQRDRQTGDKQTHTELRLHQ